MDITVSHTLELFQNCTFSGTVQNIDSTSCEKLIHAWKQKTQTLPELSASFRETPIHNLCCQLPRFHSPTKSGEKMQQQQPIIKPLISLVTSAEMHSCVGRFPQAFMLYKLSLRQRFSIHKSFVVTNNYAIIHWCAVLYLFQVVESLKGMSRQIFYLFFITCIEHSLKVIPAMVK